MESVNPSGNCFDIDLTKLPFRYLIVAERELSSSNEAEFAFLFHEAVVLIVVIEQFGQCIIPISFGGWIFAAFAAAEASSNVSSRK